MGVMMEQRSRTMLAWRSRSWCFTSRWSSSSVRWFSFLRLMILTATAWPVLSEVARRTLAKAPSPSTFFSRR